MSTNVVPTTPAAYAFFNSPVRRHWGPESCVNEARTNDTPIVNHISHQLSYSGVILTRSYNNKCTVSISGRGEGGFRRHGVHDCVLYEAIPPMQLHSMIRHILKEECIRLSIIYLVE